MRQILRVSLSILLVLAVSRLATAAEAGGVLIHPEQEAKSPTLTSDSKGQLHLAYEAYEKDKDSPDIFYTFSKDGGKTWSKGVDVSKTPGVSSEPQIAVGSAGEIVVAWADTAPGAQRQDIFAATSNDSGKTWSSPFDVSSTPGKSSEPSICIGADGGFHIVWRDTGDDDSRPQDIYYAKSTNHGQSWSKAVDVSNTAGISSAPEIACGPKGVIAVTWSDNTSSENQDIWFNASSDGGKTWGTGRNVSTTPGLSANPTIAIDGKGNIYVAWDDVSAGEAKPDIFFLISRDGGKTFEKSLDVSKTPGASSNPEVAATSDGHVAVVWVDAADTKPTDIWVAGSSDSGKTFSTASDLSNTPSLSGAPDIAIVYGTVYAVWEETDGSKTHLKASSLALK